MLLGTIATAVLLFLLVGLPAHSSALTVSITSGGQTKTTNPNGGITCTTSGGNPTTTLSCNTVTVGSVTVTNQTGGATGKWRVVASQSGQLVKVTLVNTKITATNVPQSVLIRAESSGSDFTAVNPLLTKAGVVLNANLLGAVQGNAGNKISLKGTVSTNIINNLNQTTGVSLPLSATGTPTGGFTAVPVGTISTGGTKDETIAITCPLGQTTCVPTVSVEVNATLTCAACSWNLPNGGGVGFTPTGNIQAFNNTFAPSFGDFDAWLQIFKGSKFSFESLLTLGGTEKLDLVNKAVQLSWQPVSQGSSFSATIPPGSFKLIKPRVWFFKGIVDEIPLAATIAQFDSAGKKFGVLIAGVEDSLVDTDDQITARLAVGDQSSEAVITPKFFP